MSPILFQDSSPHMHFVLCPSTRAHPRAISRTSTRFSECLAQPHRKKSRKRTTRSARAPMSPDLLAESRELTMCLLSTHPHRWPRNTTPTPTRTTHKPRRSLLSWPKPTRFSLSLFFSLQAVAPNLATDVVLFALQVLSDEGKRKQYDVYGTAGFDAGQAGGGQQYWGGQTSNVNPEELFRKIFGEFSGGRGFGDFSAMFDQPQEVCHSGSFSARPSKQL